METISVILLILGYIIMFIAGIWILVLAFQESIGWGLACLLLPFVSLIFVALNWPETKRPFLMYLAGLVPVILAFIIAPKS